jgi:hypothetical protein
MRDEYGNDTEAAFEAYVSKLLSHRLPDAKPFLLERMAKAITVRRRRFNYRSRHQSKLAQAMPDKAGRGNSSKYTGQSADGRSTVLGAQTKTDGSRTAIGPIPRIRTSASIVSATSASKFNTNQFRSSRLEGSIVATTAHIVNDHKSNVAVPDPPPTKRGAKEFECPYCHLMLPTEEAAAMRWR